MYCDLQLVNLDIDEQVIKKNYPCMLHFSDHILHSVNHTQKKKKTNKPNKET